MKKLKLSGILVLMLSIWIVNSSHAEDTLVFIDMDSVYKTLQENNQCILMIEKERQKGYQLQLNYDSLNEQVTILDKQKEFLNIQLDTLEKLSHRQSTALSDTLSLVDSQKKGYEEIIKASKPSFFDEVKKGSMFMLIGVVIGVMLI